MTNAASTILAALSTACLVVVGLLLLVAGARVVRGLRR